MKLMEQRSEEDNVSSLIETALLFALKPTPQNRKRLAARVQFIKTAYPDGNRVDERPISQPEVS